MANKEYTKYIESIRWTKARLLHPLYGLSVAPNPSEEDKLIGLKYHDLVADYLVRHPEIEKQYFNQKWDWKVHMNNSMKGQCPKTTYGYYEILRLAEEEKED